MPTVTHAEQTAYAHCGTPTCPGSRQVAVDGVRRETSYAFTENGGDIPGIERSTVEWTFADEGDRPCPSCGRPREISDQAKPSYDPLSGFDPMGLLTVDPFDPGKRNTVEDEKVAQLEAKNAALEAKLDQLIEKLGD